MTSPSPLNKTEQLMILLSLIAYKNLYRPVNDRKMYEDIDAVLANVRPKQQIVWGPAFRKKNEHTVVNFLVKEVNEVFTALTKETAKVFPNIEEISEFVSDSLIYVTQNARSQNEYTVVIRGTNPLSVTTLLKDFDVAKLRPWGRGEAPAEALISDGTGHFLSSYLQMAPVSELPGAGETLWNFFQKLCETKRVKINFTGHSLGGLMASILGLWFKEELQKDRTAKKAALQVYSIAAPTAGNQEFVNYLEQVLGNNCALYANQLDLTIHAWVKDDLHLLPNIYEPLIHSDPLIKGMCAFLEKVVSRDQYTQLRKVRQIPSSVVSINLPILKFLTQAVYQHIHPYRKALDPAEQPPEVWAAVDQILEAMDPVS